MSFSEVSVQLWRSQVPTRKNLLAPDARIISSTLSVGENVKSVYTLLKLVGVSLEVGATSLIKRTLRAYRGR